MPNIIIRTAPDTMPGEATRRVYGSRGTVAITRACTVPATRLHRFVLTHVPTGLMLDGAPMTLAKARKCLASLPEAYVDRLGEVGGWPENHTWEAGLIAIRARPAHKRAATLRP